MGNQATTANPTASQQPPNAAVGAADANKENAFPSECPMREGRANLNISECPAAQAEAEKKGWIFDKNAKDLVNPHNMVSTKRAS